MTDLQDWGKVPHDPAWVIILPRGHISLRISFTHFVYAFRYAFRYAFLLHISLRIQDANFLIKIPERKHGARTSSGQVIN